MDQGTVPFLLPLERIFSVLGYLWKASSMVRLTPAITLLALAIQHYTVPGIYSAIFVKYLQHEVSTGNSQNQASRNRVFYALCLLYFLSTATFDLDFAVVFIYLRIYEVN